MSTPSSLQGGSVRPRGRAAPPVVFWPLLSTGLLLATPASTQDVRVPPASPVWADQVSGPAHAYATALAAYGSDVYVATTGTDGETNAPVSVRKYGADGAPGWVKDIDTGTADGPALWADDLGVCIAGATLATLDGSPPEPFADAVGFVRCLAADGSLLWTDYIEAQTGARAPQVFVLAMAGRQNALYVVGTTTEVLKDCGAEACVSSGGWDAFIRKYSRDGVPEWTRQLGTPGADESLGVGVDRSGEVSVWGLQSSNESLEFVVALARYAANGTLRQSAALPLGAQWPYDAGFAESTFCLASRETDPDAVATDLRCYGWDRKSEPRLDWHGSLDAWVHDVVALPSGLLIAGRVYPALPGQQGAGYYDGFVRRYDAAGQTLEGALESWTIEFGTPYGDEASAVAQDAGRIFVAGSTGGRLAPQVGEVAPTDTDAYVARFAVPFAADAGGPYSVDEGSSVALSASATFVDCGQTLAYAWDLDRDGIFEEAGQTVAYTPADGTGEAAPVRVRVTDEDSMGTAEAAATVVVANVAPVVDVGPDVVLDLGQPLSRQGTFTDPGADTWTAIVDYGDQSASDVQELSDRTFTLAHPYDAPGTYTVAVRVTDKDGGVGTAGFAVVVSGDVASIGELIRAIEQLVHDDVLNPGQGNSFIAKLRAAQAALDVADDQTAVENLRAFTNEVNAFERAEILDPGQAANLVHKAQTLITSISS